MDIYEDILHAYWGYPSFRGIQRQIIDSIGAGRDTLGLMPTGGGKSLTFQVPAMAMDGVCVVITPLIALMKDQVMHLRERGISAAAIHAGMSRQEIVVVLENCIFGGCKLLYVSPERLASDLFQAKLKHMRVSFITVDEAHCISQWGYDFRPHYLRIADIRKLKPGVPVLALTATATPQVVDDIQQRLGFAEPNVYRMSFERKNLAYIVREAPDKNEEMVHILRAVAGSAIVYVRSRKRTKEIAAMLCGQGISATHFHAGLDIAIKDQHQQAWQQGEQRVIVATNAFGMGIDKPDVRVVIHYDCPDSIEAYFQEAGRAGRDGLKAYAVLLYDQSDRRKLDKRIIDNFPDKDYIRDVYEHLAYYYQIGVGSGGGHTFSFEIDKFCHTYHYFPIQVDASLKILQRAGYLVYETDPDASARLMFLLGRNELYRLEQTSPEEEAAITALLRNYGGLFTDYVYIDESLIAQQSGLTPHQLYYVLKSLSQRRIVHFIPQRKTPYITYLQDREDVERVVLAPSVYEERREQFAMRIHALLAYAENHEVCRSRQLLDYFGETRSDDCRCCDVCIAQSKQSYSEGELQMPISRIRTLLDGGGRHPITDLLALNLPKRLLDAALRTMVDEEIVWMEDGEIFLSE